jgi:hypothetical protein
MADDDYSDSVTEVTTQGFGSRIMGSLGGVVFGLILFIASFPLLIWNEGRAVDTAKALAEGRAAVITVAPEPVAPRNDGRLVYVSGPVTSRESLAPNGVLPSPALKLKRTVEVYQWQEQEDSNTKKELGGSQTTTTTYSYKKVWSSSTIESSRFKKPEGHANPSSKPLQDKTAVVKDATLGAFRLGAPVLDLLDTYQPVPGDALAKLARQDGRGQLRVSGDWAYSGDAEQPRVGDMRVGYAYVPLGVVSVVARQSGSLLEPYTTSNGHELVMAETGAVSADRLFKAEEEGNAILTWALRAAGWVAMMVGLMMMVGPISVLASIIPFLGDLLSAGAFMVALPLSLCLSLVTVAIAWIAFRPLIGIPLLLAGLAAFIVPALRRRSAAAAHR